MERLHDPLQSMLKSGFRASRGSVNSQPKAKGISNSYGSALAGPGRAPSVPNVIKQFGSVHAYGSAYEYTETSTTSFERAASARTYAYHSTAMSYHTEVEQLVEQLLVPLDLPRISEHHQTQEKPKRPTWVERSLELWMQQIGSDEERTMSGNFPLRHEKVIEGGPFELMADIPQPAPLPVPDGGRTTEELSFEFLQQKEEETQTPKSIDNALSAEVGRQKD